MSRYVTSIFGSALDAKDQRWLVSAGWVIREGLAVKKYKAADDQN
jgi:hypothetical protein